MREPSYYSSMAAASLLIIVAAVAPSSLAQSYGHRFTDPVGYRYQAAKANSQLVSPILPATPSDPEVTIPILGTAKAAVMQTLFGRNISAFHSIPYAHKPVRFHNPKLLDDAPWSGNITTPYDATYFRDKCAQKSMILPVVDGSEDCLFASIYTPITNFSGKVKSDLPVMMYIHGGSYMTGEATLYMPTKLLDQDVVVVVVQYRLGTLGFLYSGTKDARGNMGLMDQITALRWIRKFISHFGGDRDLITVFGQSSGACSTSWLQLSPATSEENNGGEKLVHRFASMSGSALAYWTLEHDWQNSFIKQVNATGCAIDVSRPEMVECMNLLSTDQLVEASMEVFEEDMLNGGLGFVGQVPVIQTELIGTDDIELVIVEDPMTSVQEGRYRHVPTMTGAVRDEGAMAVGLVYSHYLLKRGLENNATFLKHDFLPLITAAFGISDITNSVSDAFRLGFLPQEMPLGDWDSMVGGMVDLGGMLFLKSGSWALTHAIHEQDTSVPIYYYSFEFESSDSLFEWIFIETPSIPINGGICHGDDLMYLFDMPAVFDDRQKDMVKKMTTIYSNFAKYGNPTPDEESDKADQWPSFTDEWLPFNSDDLFFMLMSDNITLSKDFTFRWNHNKYSVYTPPTTAASSSVHTKPSTAAPHHSTALAAVQRYQAVVDEGNQYKMSTTILATVSACLSVALVAMMAIAWRQRRTFTARQGLVSNDNLAMEAVQ